MKNIITTLLSVFIFINSFGQLNASFVKDTIVIERSSTAIQIEPIPVDIKGLNPPGAAAVPNILTFATTASVSTNEYQFTSGSLPSITTGTTQVAWQITILPGKNTADNTIFFPVQMTYNNGGAVEISKTVVIKIINKKAIEKEDKDDVNVSLLIGSNLDFFNSVKFKDIAGEFNIFLPKIFSLALNENGKDEINIGANLGIYNYRNFSVDSPGTITSYNYKLIPFITLDTTKKIVKATFSTRGKSTKDFQGFYIEPLFSIKNIEDRSARIFVSFHFEILKRTETIEYDNPNYIWRDTVLYNPVRDNLINEHSNILRQNPHTTFYSSYFGIGLPVSVSKKYFELYFAPTMGFSKYNVEKYETKGAGTVTINQTGPFYLCKFFFKEKVSLLGLTIGGEVRGIFGKLNPYLNAYVATRISLSKFSDFFKTASK